MNKFDEMRQAIAEAKITLRAAENIANDLATMLRGNLRHVYSTDTLKAIKKELADYNIHTGKWKKK